MSITFAIVEAKDLSGGDVMLSHFTCDHPAKVLGRVEVATVHRNTSGYTHVDAIDGSLFVFADGDRIMINDGSPS